PGDDPALLELRGLTARHGRNVVTHEVSLSLGVGSCLAVVGESGSGKTTTARAIAGLHSDYTGEVLLRGRVLAHEVRRRTTQDRREVQYVFQNPYGSFNPRHTIGRSIADARRLLARVPARRARGDAVELIERVGLRADHLLALPHQLSGGQRQRAALARALAGDPALLVCDEVTSSLDLSVQAEVVELLQRLQREQGLSMLFITHDLGLAAQLAEHTVVLLGGEVVESGPSSRVLARPEHPYTVQLLAAADAVRAASLSADRRAAR
ncbi:MAG: ABC transporter ATP-binding protein, partial [Protaetiibacter sp.]